MRDKENERIVCAVLQRCDAAVEEENKPEGGRETGGRAATLLPVHTFCTVRLHRPIYSCHLPYAVSCLLGSRSASSPHSFTF